MSELVSFIDQSGKRSGFSPGHPVQGKEILRCTQNDKQEERGGMGDPKLEALFGFLTRKSDALGMTER